LTAVAVRDSRCGSRGVGVAARRCWLMAGRNLGILKVGDGKAERLE